MAELSLPIPFDLFAPNNPQVMLLGSWNQWQPMPMARASDGHWRVQVPLADGEYEYLFEVISCTPSLEGQAVRIPDPTALAWTADDKTRLRVKQGCRVLVDYTWQHEQAPLPPNAQLIIYELHIGDFSGELASRPKGSGTFVDAINRLDYLADLGINAVEILPVTARPPGFQMGYSQQSLYAVEEELGTPEEFARFVDACHARGIRVIHDSVYNHMADDAVLAKIDYGSWFHLANPDEYNFGIKCNYGKTDEQLGVCPAYEYAIGSMRLWMEQFHLDGLRFDFTLAMDDELLRDFRNQLQQMAGARPFITIAEQLPEDPAVAGPDGPLDAAWRQSFGLQLVATMVGKRYRGSQPFHADAVARAFDWRVDGYAGAAHIVNYTESHDEPHVMLLLEQAHQVSTDARWRRARLGATLLLTAPGVPMLWMGQEFGQTTPKSQESQPLQWELLEQPEARALCAHYRRLIHLRKCTPALTSNTLRILVADQNDLVIANLYDALVDAWQLRAPRLNDGIWRDALSDAQVEICNHTLCVNLAPSQVLVLCQAQT